MATGSGFATLPFKHANGFKALFHTVGEYDWLIVLHNMAKSGTRNGFIDAGEKEFTLSPLCMGGLVEAGKHWLLGSFDDAYIGEAGSLLALKVIKKENEKWVKDDAVTAENVEKYGKNRLAALCVTGIPFLEAVAEALAETKVIIKKATILVDVDPKFGKDKLKKELLLLLKNDSGIDEKEDDYLEEKELETLADELADFGLDLEVAQKQRELGKYPLPYKGELPKIEGYHFTIPDIKDGGGNNYSKAPAFLKPDERLAFIADPATKIKCLGILEQYGIDLLNGNLLNLALSISGANAISFLADNDRYVSVFTENSITDATKPIEEVKETIVYGAIELPKVLNRGEIKKYNAILTNVSDYFVKKPGDENYYNAWLARIIGNWCQYIDGQIQCDKACNDETKLTMLGVLSNYYNVVSSVTYTTVPMSEVEAFIASCFSGKTLVNDLTANELSTLATAFEEFDNKLAIDQKVKLADHNVVPY